MANTTRNTISNQFVNPVATDIFLDYLYESSLFAPQYFGIDGKYIQQQGNDRRPKITDVSKYINRPYTKGETVKIPTPSQLTVFTKSPNIEIVDQGVTISTVDVTITDFKYISILQEWEANVYDNIDLRMKMLKQQAQALGENFEKSIIGLFDDFTTTLGGGAGDTLSINSLAAGQAKFADNKINTTSTPVWAVVNPTQYGYLSTNGLDEYQITGSSETLNSRIIKETPSGVRVCYSANVPTVAGVAKGAMFTEEAMMCLFAIKPTVKSNTDYRKMGERDNSYYLCGYAKMRDLAGISLNFNATPAI